MHRRRLADSVRTSLRGPMEGRCIADVAEAIVDAVAEQLADLDERVERPRMVDVRIGGRS